MKKLNVSVALNALLPSTRSAATDFLKRKRSRAVIPLFIGLASVITLISLNCASHAPVGPAGPDGRRLTWDKMDIQQRQTHMRDVVLPRVAPIFRAWKPERFATIECSLCHGDAVNTGNFHMPTDHLVRLSGDLLLGHERENFPETTRLKLDRLVPAMANALGMSQFNIITRRGFGCYSCHLGPKGPMFGH